DSGVFDASAQAAMSASGPNVWVLSSPQVSGFLWIRRPDPYGGQKDLLSAVRADGRTLSLHNAWLSKVWIKETRTYDFYVNVFDVNNTDGDSYTLTFGTANPGNQAPVVAPTPNRKVRVG